MVDVPPPPPPPENPYGNNNGDESDPFAMPDNDGLGGGAPNVSAKPGRVLMVVGIMAFALLFLLYNVFFSGKKDANTETVIKRPVAPPPQEPTQIPEPPPPIIPSIGITPPVIPPPAEVKIINPKEDGTAKAEADARLRSKMLIADSGGSLAAALGGDTSNTPTSTDNNSQFAAAVAKANTKAERVEATRIGDLRRTIAQGRIIQATMESALNTDLPAPIRAIVSRDTYAESGLEPLIPKGSRLIGTYNTTLDGGQSRVFVIWTRVIRPDGIDVMINSPLVDQIGQAGVAGQVDTKFQSIFSRAILSSVVSIAFATANDKINGSGETSTTNSSSLGTTTSGDGATTATVNALNRLGSVTDSFLQKYINVKQTILVDQGTPVNVFVNKDLVFPAELVGTRVIQ